MDRVMKQPQILTTLATNSQVYYWKKSVCGVSKIPVWPASDIPLANWWKQG